MYASMITVAEWLEHMPVSAAMERWPFLFTVASILHYFSFFLVIGTSVLIDLRLLGVAGRGSSMADFAGRLLPWTWGALSLVVFTGFVMFAPDADTFFNVDFFFIKLAGLFLSIAAVVLIQWNVRKWDRPAVIPAAAKASGLISLLLWVATLLSALEISQIAGL